MGHAPAQRCGCGQMGCLESWVNLAALARYYRGTDKLTAAKYATLAADVARAAAGGDAAALSAVEAVAHYLSLGIVTLVNTFNPAAIVLGGVMRPVIQACLPAVQARVAAEIVPGTLVPEVRLSPLGDSECAIGAAALAHQRAFDVSDAGPSAPNLLG